MSPQTLQNNIENSETFDLAMVDIPSKDFFKRSYLSNSFSDNSILSSGGIEGMSGWLADSESSPCS